MQLLAYIAPADRAAALDAIERVVDEYDAAGDPVDEPAPVTEPLRPDALLAALAAGDAARVDALAAAWLPLLSPAEVVGAFGEAIVPSLAAAGHAPIGLSLLLRAGGLSTTLLRGPLRALAAQPTWRVDWHDHVHRNGDASLLYGTLRGAPYLGRPGSDFIYPLMAQAQRPGVADAILGPVVCDRYDVPAALHTVTRVAAWSMLHDDPSQAPYGWSHALTMPQGVLGLAGAGVTARTALAVASTFAVGFRLAHGTVPLPQRIKTVPLVRPVAETAATLAAAASRHHDAHLVKYTLASIHAAADDRAFAGLYMAAAQRLVDWWHADG